MALTIDARMARLWDCRFDSRFVCDGECVYAGCGFGPVGPTLIRVGPSSFYFSVENI